MEDISDIPDLTEPGLEENFEHEDLDSGGETVINYSDEQPLDLSFSNRTRARPSEDVEPDDGDPESEAERTVEGSVPITIPPETPNRSFHTISTQTLETLNQREVEFLPPQVPIDQAGYVIQPLDYQTLPLLPPLEYYAHNSQVTDYTLPNSQQYIMQMPPHYAPTFPHPYLQYPMQMPAPIQYVPIYAPQVQSFPDGYQQPIIIQDPGLQHVNYPISSFSESGQIYQQTPIIYSLLETPQVQFEQQLDPVIVGQQANLQQFAVEEAPLELEPVSVLLPFNQHHVDVQAVEQVVAAPDISSDVPALNATSTTANLEPISVLLPLNQQQLDVEAVEKVVETPDIISDFPVLNAGSTPANLEPISVLLPLNQQQLDVQAVEQVVETPDISSDFPALNATSTPANKKGLITKSGNRSKRQKSKFIPLKVPINYRKYQAAAPAPARKERSQKPRKDSMELFSFDLPAKETLPMPDFSERTEVGSFPTENKLLIPMINQSSQTQDLPDIGSSKLVDTTRKRTSKSPSRYQRRRMTRGARRRYYNSRIVWNSEISDRFIDPNTCPNIGNTEIPRRRANNFPRIQAADQEITPASSGRGKTITKTSQSSDVLNVLTTGNRFSLLQDESDAQEEIPSAAQDEVEILEEEENDSLPTIEEVIAEELVVTDSAKEVIWQTKSFPELLVLTPTENSIQTTFSQGQEHEQLPTLQSKFEEEVQSHVAQSDQSKVKQTYSWHEEAFPEDALIKISSSSRGAEPVATIVAKKSKVKQETKNEASMYTEPNELNEAASETKQLESKTSKKQIKQKKQDSATLEAETIIKKKRRGKKSKRTKSGSPLVNSPNVIQSLPIISQDTTVTDKFALSDDDSLSKKTSKRNSKSKKQTGDSISSDPNIFLFGSKKLETEAPSKKNNNSTSENRDLSPQPGPSGCSSSKGGIITDLVKQMPPALIENANTILQLTNILRSFEYGNYTKQRKLSKEDSWINLTAKNSLGLHTEGHPESQRTQSGLQIVSTGTKSTGAIRKTKLQKKKTRIRPETRSSVPVHTKSEPGFCFEDSVKGRESSITSNDGSKKNDSDVLIELENKMAVMDFTAGVDSDIDEENQVKSVRLAFEEAFRPRKNLCAFENENEQSIESIVQINYLNIKISKAKMEIDRHVVQLMEPDVESEPIIDALETIRKQVEEYQLQIKVLKDKVSAQKNAKVSKKPSPREENEPTQYSPRFTFLPVTARAYNVEARINLLQHLDPSFTPLPGGDITADFLKSWIYKKKSSYEHETQINVTSELDMVTRYRNNRQSIPAHLINPRYEDIFHDFFPLQLKVVIPYGTTHVDIVLVTNKKRFILSLDRRFNEIFYEFNPKSMVGCKIDPYPIYVNNLNGPYEYRFIALDRSSGDVFLIATKGVTAIFIKLDVSPGFAVDETYCDSNSRAYKDFAIKAKQQEENENEKHFNYDPCKL